MEGQELNVTCRVTGGSPRPEVEFMLMADNKTKIENSTLRFQDPRENPMSDGVLEVVATLRPGEEDQGRLVCCHVKQWDHSQPRQSLASQQEVPNIWSTNKSKGFLRDD